MNPTTLDTLLSFAVNGKLEKLAFAARPNLLHSGGRAFDLGGKYFQPTGWDECFPTIEPYRDCPVMGDLVGRAPEIRREGDTVAQVWHAEHFEARRTFSLKSPTCLLVSFQATNSHDVPLEYLWASHALFTAQCLREVRFGDTARVSDFRLNGTQTKFFIANIGAVELVYSHFRVLLTTDQPWWGIWLNRGGWPEQNAEPFVCLGVEATSAPGEHPLGDQLQPGETFRGSVKLEFRA